MSYQNDVADFMKAGEQPVRSELSLEGDQATLYYESYIRRISRNFISIQD